MCPFLYFLCLNEPGLGIDPAMALTPLTSIRKRRASNPRRFDCEPRSLTPTPSSHSTLFTNKVKINLLLSPGAVNLIHLFWSKVCCKLILT